MQAQANKVYISLKDSGIYGYYYNSDGNNGEGQVVVNYWDYDYINSMLKDFKENKITEDEFINCLDQDAKQNLVDISFEEYKNYYMNNEFKNNLVFQSEDFFPSLFQKGLIKKIINDRKPVNDYEVTVSKYTDDDFDVLIETETIFIKTKLPSDKVLEGVKKMFDLGFFKFKIKKF